jgi:hypothetical protein
MATKVSLLTNFVKIEAPEDTYYVNSATLSMRFKGSIVILSDPGTDIYVEIAFADFQDGDSNPYSTEATIAAYMGGIAGGGGGGGGTSSPLTTKGDIWTYDTDDQRLAVGANDTVLTADSAQATGVKWAAPAGGGGSFYSGYFYIDVTSTTNWSYIALVSHFTAEVNSDSGFDADTSAVTNMTDGVADGMAPVYVATGSQTLDSMGFYLGGLHQQVTGISVLKINWGTSQYATMSSISAIHEDLRVGTTIIWPTNGVYTATGLSESLSAGDCIYILFSAKTTNDIRPGRFIFNFS